LICIPKRYILFLNIQILKKGETMIITNVENVPGKVIAEHFGIVQGSTVRAKNVGRDIMASLKNLVGGELKGYTELLNEARRESLDRMEEQAKTMGANAVVNVRFATSSVAQGASELFAYGTAVRLESE
jgi:uncharacterized protein YbjQ (UPF0145 family)